MPKGKGYKRGDLNKDGKMSSYEAKRDKAIKNAIAKKKVKDKLKIAQWQRRKTIFSMLLNMRQEQNLRKQVQAEDQVLP